MNIQNAYNEWSDSYDSNQNLTRDLDSAIIHRLLTARHFKSILEIGCGTGKNTVFLAEVADRVHALDFSAGMLSKARAKVKADHVTFETADLTHSWPCIKSEYDLIVCSLVLEHVADLAHIFAEAQRVLRPGGQFIIHELHPFKQYGGSQARFEHGSQTVTVTAYTHHISEFIHAADAQHLHLQQFDEHWHPDDAGKPPRLVAFIFEKSAA